MSGLSTLLKRFGVLTFATGMMAYGVGVTDALLPPEQKQEIKEKIIEAVVEAQVEAEAVTMTAAEIRAVIDGKDLKRLGLEGGGFILTGTFMMMAARSMRDEDNLTNVSRKQKPRAPFL